MATPLYPHAGQSVGAKELAALARGWDELRDDAARDGAFRLAARELSRRVTAHRDQLFAANAKLQGDSPADDHVATSERIEANQDAIKTCTTILSEMASALGLESIRE